MASADFKVGARILLVGYNGSGKSSLINKLAGNDYLARVNDTVLQTQHEAAAIQLQHNLQIDRDTIPVMFINTQGFGDTSTSDRKIAESIARTVQEVDVVLLCHRLYRKVDRPITEELKELARILGNRLMQHAIIVFTCGDEYMTNCRPKPVSELSNDEIKRQMQSQAKHIIQEMIAVLISNGISQEIAYNIPYCITSADQDDLPTGDWVDDLWQKCESKYTPEAKSFVNRWPWVSKLFGYQ